MRNFLGSENYFHDHRTIAEIVGIDGPIASELGSLNNEAHELRIVLDRRHGFLKGAWVDHLIALEL